MSWYNSSQGFLSRKIPLNTLLIGAEQEYDHFALITSLCSCNHLQACHDIPGKEMEVLLGTKTQLQLRIKLGAPRASASILRSWDLQISSVGKSNPFPKPQVQSLLATTKRTKVHFAGIITNSNPIHIGTQKISPSEEGDQPKKLITNLHSQMHCIQHTCITFLSR